jgi:flagellar biosynthesis protein FliQ
MKPAISSSLFAGLLIAFIAASCQQEQHLKSVPKIESVSSSTIHIQHDSTLFNKVMNAPHAPDSIP